MIKLPPGSVALYRICTTKSKLGFGKYQDLTVGDILYTDPEYLVWCYATYEKISFHKDILDELGVRQITKPGVDPSILREWMKMRREGFSREEQLHGYMKKKRMLKRRALSKLISTERAVTFSKGELQAINHGKKRN